VTTPALGGGAASPLRRPFSRPASIALIVVILLVVIGLLRSVFAHHETAYERIAREMTVALQNNDLAGVQKFQNAETATQVTHAVVGRDADAFAPLGKLQRVLETPVTADQTARRIHEFDAAFDKATAHETIRFDPDNKVVGFKYELLTPK
jgi:hypothetical protein